MKNLNKNKDENHKATSSTWCEAKARAEVIDLNNLYTCGSWKIEYFLPIRNAGTTFYSLISSHFSDKLSEPFAAQ